jgi:hypothetical protein
MGSCGGIGNGKPRPFRRGRATPTNGSAQTEFPPSSPPNVSADAQLATINALRHRGHVAVARQLLTGSTFTGNSWCDRARAASHLGIIGSMTETAEHPTTPTLTADPPPPRVGREVHHREGPNRLYQVLAWVGIVAGVVFIVAVVFFSGFFLGRHSGPAHGHFGSHQGRGVHFFHRTGPPPMGPMAPMAPMGPMGPMGPGGSMGPSSPSTPASPTTLPSPTPRP